MQQFLLPDTLIFVNLLLLAYALGWYLYLNMKIEESDEVKFNTTTLNTIFIIPMLSFNNTVTHYITEQHEIVN
jgi:hypothetical protein